MDRESRRLIGKFRDMCQGIERPPPLPFRKRLVAEMLRSLESGLFPHPRPPGFDLVAELRRIWRIARLALAAIGLALLFVIAISAWLQG